MCPASSPPTSWFSRAERAGEIEAPVVFAGYGRIDPERNIDDYKDLDVKDRFVFGISRTARSGAGAATGGGRRMRAMSSTLASGEDAEEKARLSACWKSSRLAARRPIPEVPLSGKKHGLSNPSMSAGPHAKTSVPAITLSDPIRDLLVDPPADSPPTPKANRSQNGGVRTTLPLRRDNGE